MIYLDHAATTPVPRAVADAMYEVLTEQFGNPSSQYPMGLEMKRRVEVWRKTVADALGCGAKQLFFTSCGTESDNWAIRLAAHQNRRVGKHIITTAVEHSAVLEPCRQLEQEGYAVTYLAPDRPALIYQSFNWDYMSSFGALAVIPLRIGERFTSRITLVGFDYLLRNRDFYGMDYKRSKWVGRASMDNTLRLSRKPDLVFEFSGSYQTEAIQCTYDLTPSWQVDAGIKWTIAGGKADLSIKGNDLFDSVTPVSKVDFGQQHLRMGNRFYTRNVTVNFAYRFGGYKEKERKKVDTSRFGH